LKKKEYIRMVKQFIKKNNGKYIRLDLKKIMMTQIPKIVIELELSAMSHNTSLDKMKESQVQFLVAIKMVNYMKSTYDLDKESTIKALEAIEKTL